jgi:ketosteroid isomerase-like protein
LEDDMGVLNAAGLLLVAGILSATPAYAEEPLTEPRIMAMFEQLEASIRGRDARGVAGHFSPDAVIRLVMPPAAGGQKMEMGVQQYTRMLEQAWAVAESFTYTVEDIVIQVSPDGRTAQVSDTTVESMRIRGQTISSRTREHFSVVSRGGRPVVTRLTGRVQM